MVVPVKKVPPPPPIAQNDPMFNRWLHDLTAFLSEDGGIAPGIIPGYDILVSTVAIHTSQIANHTSQISSLTGAVGANTASITTLFSTTAIHEADIATLFSTTAVHTTQISANAANIITLAARSQVWNGIVAPLAGTGANGDWYADTVAKHIYVKSGDAWVLIV